LITAPEKPHPRMPAPSPDQLALLRKLAAGDRVILDPNTQQVMLVGDGEEIDSRTIHALLRHGWVHGFGLPMFGRHAGRITPAGLAVLQDAETKT
jgi:hypothetical protein